MPPCQDEPFEVALLDFHMPECDGEQLGRLIRTYDHLTHTRLVLLTSSGHRGDAQRFADLGFAGYLRQADHAPRPHGVPEPRHVEQRGVLEAAARSRSSRATRCAPCAWTAIAASCSPRTIR